LNKWNQNLEEEVCFDEFFVVRQLMALENLENLIRNKRKF